VHSITLAALRRAHQTYLPREFPIPLPDDVASLDEVLGRVVPIDLIPALAGHRGAVLHIGGGEQ
jgi:hypothetical protein